MAFNIQRYMTRGVVRVVTDSLRATAKNSKESKFMKSFASASRVASKKRYAAEKKGEHIPPFLIASITSTCNLHCAGCYSRSNNACCDSAPVNQLSAEEWNKIFAEADELGISFILLAGGEPLMRYDVIEQASQHKNIMFPIFTNGTFLSEKYLDVLDEHRNLVPIISIEGDEKITDERRGDGVYKKVTTAMQSIKDRGMIFGASVTVTTENIYEVYSDEFLDNLYDLGCKAVIFVEFVPVTEESTHLAPTEKEQKFMHKQIKKLRRRKRGMVFIAFPGDEKSSGGCVAAGRGFFHINSHGGAEPCPFSPYSDINVRDTSLREALKSPLFAALQSEGLLVDDHIGGCTLYMNRDKVEALIKSDETAMV
ncbi:MAG: radical SAM protein [Eubacterium sp.]|nr:radical SAM protein [Eubacterium sp.]